MVKLNLYIIKYPLLNLVIMLSIYLIIRVFFISSIALCEGWDFSAINEIIRLKGQLQLDLINKKALILEERRLIKETQDEQQRVALELLETQERKNIYLDKIAVYDIKLSDLLNRIKQNEKEFDITTDPIKKSALRKDIINCTKAYDATKKTQDDMKTYVKTYY